MHRGFPRLVNPFGRQLRELRYPAAHIVAVGIELLALEDGIEDAEVGRGIGAAATGPLPAHRVGTEVGVDEGIPIPLRPGLPGLQEVLHEHGGGDHAHAVVLPARRPELPHAGIDDRVAGATTLPSTEVFLVRRPREFLELATQRAVGGLGEVVDKVLGEFAPTDLGDVLVPALAADLAGGADGVDDLER